MLGYHDHYVVDGGKHRIILHALVTPADVMENQPMLDQLRRVMFRWKLDPKRAIADTTYGTVENIVALEDMGIRAYVPLPDFDERTEYWGRSHFTYDKEHDRYQCPRGELLTRWKTKYTEGKIVYRADAKACNCCPMKARCTGSENGRTIHRSLYEAYLERVRMYHETADMLERIEREFATEENALLDRVDAAAPRKSPGNSLRFSVEEKDTVLALVQAERTTLQELLEAVERRDRAALSAARQAVGLPSEEEVQRIQRYEAMYDRGWSRSMLRN